MNESKPHQTVMVRRGDKVARYFPARWLVPYIKANKLLGSDEVSADGVKWVRMDRHRQLAPVFAPRPTSKDDSDPSVSPPPGIEDQLTEMADMLREINGQ